LSNLNAERGRTGKKLYIYIHVYTLCTCRHTKNVTRGCHSDYSWCHHSKLQSSWKDRDKWAEDLGLTLRGRTVADKASSLNALCCQGKVGPLSYIAIDVYMYIYIYIHMYISSFVSYLRLKSFALHWIYIHIM
jgi:hypothetical protein